MSAVPVATVSLRDLQAWFLELVTDERELAEALKEPANPASGGWMPVRASRGVDATRRLAVYRHAYFARLEECLADDYGALRHALGEHAFGEACRAYVAARPSRSRNLNRYGAGLAEFLRSYAPSPNTFLLELARLEWAIVEAIHARSIDGLGVAALGQVPPGQLGRVRFSPNPALAVLSFTYPVSAYLQAFLDGEGPSLPEPAWSGVAVVRQGYRLRRVPLEPLEYRVLERLVAGQALAEAMHDVQVTPAEVQSWFRSWTECGFFEGIEG